MGQILYMKQKTKPTNNVLVFDLFKFFVNPEDQKIFVSKNVSPNFILAMEEILKDSYAFVYFDEDLNVCPVCGALLNKNGTQKFILNKKLLIFKQSYICSDKKCKFTIIAHPEDYIRKNCNYTNEIKEKATYYSFIDYNSYQKKTEMLNLHFATEMSRQTIFNAQKDLINEYLTEEENKLFEEIKKLKIENSGIYCYDEEFIKISKVVYVRMTLVDAKTRIIIADELIRKDDFNQKTIKKFLKESLDGLKIKIIVTDGYKAYEEIIKELGAKHQKCVFHIMENLMTPLQKLINKMNIKIKNLETKIVKKTNKIKELRKTIPNKKGRAKKTETKLLKTREKIKKIQLEINDIKFEKRKTKKRIKRYIRYKERIKLIFKSKTYKTAMKRFNQLKSEMEKLPDVFKNFIKNLEKKIDKALNHTIDREIPKTNNLAELIYRTTFPGKIKKIYRTFEGAKNQIRANDIRWMKRNVLGQN